LSSSATTTKVSLDSVEPPPMLTQLEESTMRREFGNEWITALCFDRVCGDHLVLPIKGIPAEDRGLRKAMRANDTFSGGKSGYHREECKVLRAWWEHMRWRWYKLPPHHRSEIGNDDVDCNSSIPAATAFFLLRSNVQLVFGRALPRNLLRSKYILFPIKSKRQRHSKLFKSGTHISCKHTILDTNNLSQPVSCVTNIWSAKL